MIPPLPFVWTGDGMRPLRCRLADQHFVIGETYTLIEHQDRSQASHNHYFAAVHEAWLNLPETEAHRFPDDKSLRGFALITAGFHTSEDFVCASRAEALRLCAFLSPRPDEPYTLTIATGPVVTRYRPKSQSMKAMGKDEFQRSKDAVLEVLAGLIGVAPQELQAQAA